MAKLKKMTTMDTEIKALLIALTGATGWLGYLARNYFTNLASIKLEETRNRQENAQRQIENQEKYFEILLQNILLVVGEEKDRGLALQEQIVNTNKALIESNQTVIDAVRDLRASNDLLHQQLKMCLLPTVAWDGLDRRSTNS